MDTPSGFDLRGSIERHPYRTLLIAAGVGYVVGGGLFTRWTYLALRLGIRVGVPLLRAPLEGVALVLLTPRPQAPSPLPTTPGSPGQEHRHDARQDEDARQG